MPPKTKATQPVVTDLLTVDLNARVGALEAQIPGLATEADVVRVAGTVGKIETKVENIESQLKALPGVIKDKIDVSIQRVMLRIYAVVVLVILTVVFKDRVGALLLKVLPSS
jgi:hypothetical protein